MMKRFLSALLALCLLLAVLPVSASAAGQPAPAAQSAQYTSFTEEEVLQRMLALKPQYPNGMPWTNDNYYGWKGGIYSGGYGCAGFAFMLSDAAFGDLPARMYTRFTYESLRPGTIVRLYNNSHSVIILEVAASQVTVAEGNINSSIYWGRTIPKQEIMQADYIMDRYPQAIPTPTPVPTPTPTPTPTPKPTPTPTPAPTPFLGEFTDVKEGKWYSDAVEYVYKQGIMNGQSNTVFGISAPTTRAQLVAILYRLEGEPTVTTANSFNDVTQRWAVAPVEWAAANGIVSGKGDRIFAPNQNVSRQDFATILYRYAKYKNYETSVAADLYTYRDINSLSSYAFPAMAWAVEEGLFTGTSSTSLSPRGAATRAQAATVIKRFMDTVAYTSEPAPISLSYKVNNETLFTVRLPGRWAGDHVSNLNTSSTISGLPTLTVRDRINAARGEGKLFSVFLCTSPSSYQHLPNYKVWGRIQYKGTNYYLVFTYPSDVQFGASQAEIDSYQSKYRLMNAIFQDGIRLADGVTKI